MTAHCATCSCEAAAVVIERPETAATAYRRGREDEQARWEAALHMSRLPSIHQRLLVGLYEGDRR